MDAAAGQHYNTRLFDTDMLCSRHEYLHATLHSSAPVVMQAVLLFANGLAILNNERFLEPCKSAIHAAVSTSLWCMLLSCQKGCSYICHCNSQMAGATTTCQGGGHSLDSGKPGALKQQTIGLLHAIAYLRSEPPWLPMHHSLFLKIELLCASGPASDSEA